MLVILSLTVAVITKDLRIVSLLSTIVLSLISLALKLSIVVVDSLSIPRASFTAVRSAEISPLDVTLPLALYVFFQPVKSVVESSSSVGTVISPIPVILSLTVAVITSDFKISSWLDTIVFNLISLVLILSIVVADSLSIPSAILTAVRSAAISPLDSTSPPAV